MILAIPRCMSQHVMIITILHFNLLVVLFCRMPVRISNLTKSFLLSQGRNARRLYGTTSLAGGFRLYKKSPRYPRGKETRIKSVYLNCAVMVMPAVGVTLCGFSVDPSDHPVNTAPALATAVNCSSLFEKNLH